MRLSPTLTLLGVMLSLVPFVAAANDQPGSVELGIGAGSGFLALDLATSDLDQSIRFGREGSDSLGKRQHAAAVKAITPQEAKAAVRNGQSTDRVSNLRKAAGAAKTAKKPHTVDKAGDQGTKQSPANSKARSNARANTSKVDSDFEPADGRLQLLPAVRFAARDPLSIRDALKSEDNVVSHSNKAGNVKTPADAPAAGHRKDLKTSTDALHDQPKSTVPQAGRSGKALAEAQTGKKLEKNPVISQARKAGQPLATPEVGKQAKIPTTRSRAARKSERKTGERSPTQREPAKLPARGKGAGKPAQPTEAKIGAIDPTKKGKASAGASPEAIGRGKSMSRLPGVRQPKGLKRPAPAATAEVANGSTLKTKKSNVHDASSAGKGLPGKA